MNRNNLSAMHCEKNCNTYFFDYREIDKERYNIREIYYLNKDVDTMVINNIYELFDKKGSLRLTGESR